jgi:hypothetical protein
MKIEKSVFSLGLYVASFRLGEQFIIQVGKTHTEAMERMMKIIRWNMGIPEKERSWLATLFL